MLGMKVRQRVDFDVLVCLLPRIGLSACTVVRGVKRPGCSQLSFEVGVVSGHFAPYLTARSYVQDSVHASKSMIWVVPGMPS